MILLLMISVVGATDLRFNCYPELDANQTACEARGCVWTPPDLWSNGPWCYFKKKVGYALESQEESTSTYILRKTNDTVNPWDTELDSVKVISRRYGNILNVRIGVDGRYEPPVDFPREFSSDESEVLILETSEEEDLWSFSVVRNETGCKLFDTSIGGLVFSDQFIQIATKLPSENMYGWGENLHQSLKHNFSSYVTWAMFARDQIPNSGSLDTMNIYGVHPYYLIVEPDGNAHGVLILNSNAQEVTTAPGPSLIYRTIGGLLDIYFFPGPTPEQVTMQYLQFIGKPFLPAYWALGYQLSRYGYQGLAEMKEKIQAVRDAGIPIDIGVADVDYKQRYQDFTTADDWSGFADFIQDLHSWGMKLILIFDPAVDVTSDAFQRALSSDAKFVEWPDKSLVQHSVQNLYPEINDSKIMLSVVWPDHHVAFPDFLDSSNRTARWWIDEFSAFHSKIAFDGIWIDMNEPSVLGTNWYHGWYYNSTDHPDVVPLKCQTNGSDRWETPPYKTHAVWRYGDEKSGAFLSSSTLCMVASQDDNYRFYDVKNLYGLTEAMHTQQALFEATGKRGAVISRSTFPSSGRFAGHWLGDNTARWEDLRTSVIGVQEFNLFGIPYVGSDVCGFAGASNEELCLRWQQLGAFHSFFRNHNDIKNPPQDPTVWPSVTVAARDANLFRYQYLLYLFSLHFTASKTGATVIRPVFFEFPNDSKTYELSYQFMWGPSILVAPVVHETATSVSVYLPDDTWYSLFDYNYGMKVDGNRKSSFPAPWTSRIPVFARGGSIIPRQTPSMTTTASRENPFELLIAPCKLGMAEGILYWDDGETIVRDFDSHDYHQFDFNYNYTETGASLLITHSKESSINLPSLDILEVLNYPTLPDFDSFSINGQSINIDKNATVYYETSKVLYISTKDLVDLKGSDIVIEWKNTVITSGGLASRNFLFLVVSCFILWLHV